MKPFGKLLGRITTHYNENFKLFLSTIDPNSLLEGDGRLRATGTKIFNSFESVVGWGNIPILISFASLSILLQSYTIFFYCTSFFHYFIYISTYHEATRPTTSVAYGAFKRDALLYKSLALAQAALQYIIRFDFSAPDVASLALLVGGFGLATLATSRLGVDRTYFGWELGEITGECVLKFPYGTIPVRALTLHAFTILSPSSPLPLFLLTLPHLPPPSHNSTR